MPLRGRTYYPNRSLYHSRVNKKQLATINLGFVVSGKEELNRLIDNLRKIDGVTDIERATG